MQTIFEFGGTGVSPVHGERTNNTSTVPPSIFTGAGPFKLMGRVFFTLFAIALLIVVSAGCENENTRNEPATPIVIVSVPPQAQFVKRLAGDRVQVEVMIAPGANPTTYEPTMRQMRAMEQAFLYVKIGHPAFPFERAWLDQLLAEREHITVVDCAQGLDRIEGDPHIWLSPKHVHVMVETIADALQQALPEHAEAIASNLASFHAEIDALDEEIRAMLAPHEGKRFVVFHPAWGYFANQYGLEQIAIEHEHKHPAADHVAEVIALARRENIKVVFVQPQFSQASAETVAEQIDGRVVTIDPLARNWLTNMRDVARALRDGLSDQ